jgi:hypothetical protein
MQNQPIRCGIGLQGNIVKQIIANRGIKGKMKILPKIN